MKTFDMTKNILQQKPKEGIEYLFKVIYRVLGTNLIHIESKSVFGSKLIEINKTLEDIAEDVLEDINTNNASNYYIAFDKKGKMIVKELGFSKKVIKELSGINAIYPKEHVSEYFESIQNIKSIGKTFYLDAGMMDIKIESDKISFNWIGESMNDVDKNTINELGIVPISLCIEEREQERYS